MLTTIKGVYRNGKIELAETPSNIPEGVNVVVTFLNCREESTNITRYPLRGKPIRYTDPFGSIAEGDWEVLQ